MARKTSYYKLRCPKCDSEFTAVVEPGIPMTFDSPGEGPEIYAEDGCECAAELSYQELVDMIDSHYGE
jgi:hypothetical protein